MPGIKRLLAAEGAVLFFAMLLSGALSAGKSIPNIAGSVETQESYALLISSEHPAGSVEAQDTYTLLISPEHPVPGGIMRVLAAGETDVEDARIVVNGPAGPLEPRKNKEGGGPPFWRSAEFRLGSEGGYTVSLVERRKTVRSLEFSVSSAAPPRKPTSAVWENERTWGRDAEALYSAWIDALFHDAGERSTGPPGRGAGPRTRRRPGKQTRPRPSTPSSATS